MDINKIKKIEAVEGLKEDLVIQLIELKIMKMKSTQKAEMIKKTIANAKSDDKYMLTEFLQKVTEKKHFAETALIATENNMEFYNNRLNEFLKNN